MKKNDSRFLLYIILINLILRFPSFFEPHWYVDETLYLLIGKELRNGLILYKNIVDNKPPMVYLIATIFQTQLKLRLLTFFMTSAAAVGYYQFIKSFFIKKSPLIAKLSTLVLLIAISTPAFEGTIFNSEPVYISFILIGLGILVKTKFWEVIFKKNQSQKILISKRDKGFFFIAGILFGLSLLTKFPSFFSIIPVIMTVSFSKLSNKLKKTFIFYLLAGISIPILIFSCYFLLNKAFSDFMFWTFKYMFFYVDNWQYFFNFSSDTIKALFSTKIKLLILIIEMASISIIFLLKKIKLSGFFLLSWTTGTLYSVILSNRPFPNYWQPFFPAFIMLLSYLIFNLKFKEKNYLLLLFSLYITFKTLFIFIEIPFKPFPMISYYETFYKFSTMEIDKKEWESHFDPIVDESLNPQPPTMISDNEKIKSWLNSLEDQALFVWGINPMIYINSNAKLITKFPLIFFISDMEIFDEEFANIKKKSPNVIIVTKPYFYTFFNDFYIYLEKNYNLVFDLSSQSVFIKNNEK